MKRFACGLLTFALAASLAGCESSAPAWDMEVPEYPWTLTCDEFAASLQEQGTDYTRQQSGAGYSITLPEGTLYSVPVDAVALYFNADQMLESISASVPAASRGSLLDAVQDALGEPADSCRPAVINVLNQMFSVYCSSEMVQEGLSYVWHSARPLSESWSDELRAQFAEQLQHNYEQAGVRFEEQDAGTITINGEEQTQWYGSEAFDSYFANNWEFVAMFQGAEGEDGRFTMTRTMLPPDPRRGYGYPSADDLNELFLQSGDEVFWMGCTDHVAATVSLGGAQGDGWINLCVVLPPDETGSWASYATTAACWDKDSIALYSGQPSAGQKYILPYQIFDWDIVEEAGGDKTRLDLTLVYQARVSEDSVSDFVLGETVSFYPLPQILPPAEVDPDRDITLALNNGSSAPSTRTFTALAKLYWQRRQTPDPETADLSGLLAQYRGSTIVETFIGNGLEPSLEHRAALAEAAGIPGYTGTDDQDARLMQALGAPETPTGLG